MIKVMIVDDEQIVRDGIEFIIRNSFEEVKIVAMGKSGREAIELFEEFRPHLVLMDIQMPGINGIEAIRAIRESDSHVRFVIISAYEQFEYAKNAVQLGVKDYILKPINRQKLVEIINKISREIDLERRNKQREIETQEKLDKVLPVLEYGYIYSIIMNSDYEEESANYQNLLDIREEYAYMMLLELGEGENPQGLSNKIGTGIKGNQVYNSIRNTIKYKCKAVVGPLMVNRIAVLVYKDQPINEYDHRVKAIELAESISDRVQEMTGSQVYIGIGSCCNVQRMTISYSEALKAISKITDEKVLHIRDAVADSSAVYSGIKVKQEEEGILRKVEEGNNDEVAKRMRELFSKLEAGYSGQLDRVRSLATELMVLVHTAGYRNDVLTKAGNTSSYINEISELSTFFDLQAWCLNKAQEITKAIHEAKENKVSSVIGEAMTYIEENYSKDLRLKDVAEAVAISPQYFSKIFKKELGVNFIDYLTNVRMEQAKRMLKEDRLSIKEICYQIGYNDPNYFSRLFKKVVGVSPTEYN